MADSGLSCERMEEPAPYNGKVDWRAPRELAELIQVVDDGSEVYAPRLRYLLIAMEKYKLADLQGSNLMALLIRLERSRTRSGLRQDHPRSRRRATGSG